MPGGTATKDTDLELLLLQELLSVKIEFASVTTSRWSAHRFPVNDAFGTALRPVGAARIPHPGGADKEGMEVGQPFLCLKQQRLQ